ncbi:ATP-grasp domain-containing protein [Nocardioides humilatus]|uniref:biotin carboxylase n=1 Tax=Nocardioides humilatus TaxID=2607660 RepID=A0A5B1L9K2_9ACTN|nr:biotin carboxylase N-terminal domain-containing protein [Nocardioides humilatus]KAA1416964.1 ATP-grasp domain-containing protein [Nocardioides humilatus]
MTAPPFSTVLVANRGEIAVRVIRTCRELGIATVAVHSDVDAGALHVRLADEVVSLGGTTAAESYLDVSKIVAAIEQTGAEAVHPGYGFLSENADFVTAVQQAGGVFVGPPAEAMELMGSKLSARAAATAAGVPTIPGSEHPVVDGDGVRAFAARHGYPLAVKASYGGGGRGMRVVHGDDEADAAVESARREATAYFGEPEVYVERYLERPRHVEVQVLADELGTVVAVGTRDCSVQRRHQKLLEEAPASTISAETADAMFQASIALAKAVDYRGAGTLEFLAQDDEFFFLEMNTRLQVEHPVTEAVADIGTAGRVDLVAEQLRIAAGLPISFEQADLSVSGHAIELRINAEDPRGGSFLPTPGPITALQPPSGVRFDTGYERGDVVSEHYDGLVGKLVVWGEDRPAAIANARRALRELGVGGIRTTAPAHGLILEHPHFVEDVHTTRWLETESTMARALDRLADVPVEAGLPPRRLATVNGRTYWMPDDGPPPQVVLQTAERGADLVSSDGIVRSPMQGTIVKLACAAGDRVEADQVVCVLEAMKMENPLRAGRTGVVTSLEVALGDSVAPAQVLLSIEEDDA